MAKRKKVAPVSENTEPLEPVKKKRKPLSRRLILLLAVAVAVLAVSEDARAKLLDALFGAEEEVEYVPEPPTGEDPPAPLGAV